MSMASAQSKKDNPMTMISLRLPAEMVAELKRMAPLVDAAGYQPLIRRYIEQGLNTDKLSDSEKSTTYDVSQQKPSDSRVVREAGAEYLTSQVPEFITQPEFVTPAPTEWKVAMADIKEETTWGANVVALIENSPYMGW